MGNVRDMATEQSTSDVTREFREARDFLVAHREDYETAYRDFSWPEFERFNWARDWFDALAVEQPEVAALTIVEEDGEVNSRTYAEMAERSRKVAGWLTAAGLQPRRPGADGPRQQSPALGGHARLHPAGAVMIPATTLLTDADLATGSHRGDVRPVVAGGSDAGRFAGIAGHCIRVAVGEPVEGWLRYDDSYDVSATRAGGGHRGRRHAAALLHLRHDGPAEAGRAHPRVATRSATSRRCTGSVCSPATST